MKSILIKNAKIIQNGIVQDKSSVFCIDGKIEMPKATERFRNIRFFP